MKNYSKALLMTAFAMSVLPGAHADPTPTYEVKFEARINKAGDRFLTAIVSENGKNIHQARFLNFGSDVQMRNLIAKDCKAELINLSCTPIYIPQTVQVDPDGISNTFIAESNGGTFSGDGETYYTMAACQSVRVDSAIKNVIKKNGISKLIDRNEVNTYRKSLNKNVDHWMQNDGPGISIGG